MSEGTSGTNSIGTDIAAHAAATLLGFVFDLSAKSAEKFPTRSPELTMRIAA